ncbi:FAD-dependent oxidoreductase [Rhodococcus sp. WWJCD1]|nr:FAD-dependent oxidoreductase [Rhodococcus sp. WWJCD1]
MVGRRVIAYTAVIVGASIGGVRTAQALRNAGFDGRVVLVGDEAEMPYDKPPLSKAVLAGEVEPDQVRLIDEAGAVELDIDLVLGSAAIRLDVAESTVLLENGTVVRYDAVILATGASARPSPWGDRSGIHVIRSMADAVALRADLAAGGRLAVVGAGFIGAEVAATGRKLGLEVTMIDPSPVPMSRILGAEMGQRFIDLHAAHGVDVRLGVGVETIDGERGAFRIGLTDGSALDASVVVVGIGAQPNDRWLTSSGLDIDNGVVCDRFCKAVGQANVYAVGDVARFDNERRGGLTRLEHWTNAVDQATVVAHNIVTPSEPLGHRPVEYVWSDQYDWKIQIVGLAGSRENILVEHSTTPDRFAIAYASADSYLAGVVAVNWPKVVVAARRGLDNDTTFASFVELLEQLAAPKPPSGGHT